MLVHLRVSICTSSLPLRPPRPYAPRMTRERLEGQLCEPLMTSARRNIRNKYVHFGWEEVGTPVPPEADHAKRICSPQSDLQARHSGGKRTNAAVSKAGRDHRLVGQSICSRVVAHSSAGLCREAQSSLAVVVAISEGAPAHRGILPSRSALLVENHAGTRREERLRITNYLPRITP